jgi:glycosyltransferase involved in cell wall biosynthesis
MPRILFAYPEVSPLYINGGIGTYVYEMAHLLAASGGWEVDILTDLSFVPPAMRPDFAKARVSFGRAGIRLLDLHGGAGSPVNWGMPDLMRAERYYRTIERLHEERRYDVIEFPDWRGPGFLAVRHKRTAGALADTRLAVHLHSSSKDVADWQDENFLTREQLYCHDMEAYVKAHADLVLSPTEFLLRSVRAEEWGRSRPLIRTGYPISADRPSRAASEIPSRGKETLTVACVSRLELRKGQDILAQAIRRVVETAAVEQPVDFVFCGNDGRGLPGDGSMAGSIRRILEGVPNWTIQKAKPRQSLLEWLAADVDVCVVPSRGDNYPNVVLEAARAGCVLVCSDAGGIPEMLQDYDLDAGVVPAGDVAALAGSLARAVRSVRREPGIRCRLASEFEAARRRQCRRALEAYRGMVATPLRDAALPVLTAAEEPRVSVIVPVGRETERVLPTLQSVFASAYSNYEVILVLEWDAGSESASWLTGMRRIFPSLRVVQKTVQDLRDARNCGLEVATGELIVVLDTNHRLSRDMMRRCAQVLEARPGLAYVTTYLDDRPKPVERRRTRRAPTDGQPFGASALLLLENTVGRGVAMIRRRDLDKVGGYANDLSACQEWDLWLKFQEERLEGDVIPEVHGAFVPGTPREEPSTGGRGALGPPHALLRHHEDLVRRQALTIGALLLEEYARARGARSDAVIHRAVDVLGRAIPLLAGHPLWAVRYAARRLAGWTRARSWEKRKGPTSPASR